YPRHDVSRFNQNHVDAERIGLIAQGIAQSFERVLAAAVGALYRRRQQAGDRTHHKDAAAAAFAHVRQDGLGYPHDAEQIRLELTTPVLEVQVFHRAHVAHAGIVDQHVDCGGLDQNVAHRVFDGGVVANVELD